MGPQTRRTALIKEIMAIDISVKNVSDLNDTELSIWADLQEADPAVDSAFFRPEYALAAEASRGGVEVALLREDSEPVGFLPFERDERDIGRAVTWRLSDTHGLIVKQGVSWNPIELVRGSNLTALKFDHLIASQEPFQPFHYWVDKAPYMDVSDGYESYHAERRRAGTSLIRQAERKRRKLDREIGPVRFEYHTLDQDVFSALLDWKSTQLECWKLFDVFRVDWVIELLRGLCRVQSPEFSGVMSALYAGDTLTAVHLGLRSHKILCSWIPTLNPEYQRYSPGVILHLELAKSAEEYGITRIDLGRGSNPLKRSLSSGNIELAIGSVDRRPLVSALTARSHRAWNALPTSKLRNFPLAVAALKFTRDLRNRLTRN